MKKGIIFFSLLVLCLGLSGVPEKAQAGKTIELSLNLPIPPVHNRWKLAIKPWCDELEKRTGGKVKVTPYFSQALSNMAENFESVKMGLADMGECGFGVKAGQFPLHDNIFSLNRPSRYVTNGTTLFRELQNRIPEMRQELEGVKIILCHCLHPGMVVGTSKKALTSIDDFKGVKINVMGTGIVYDKAKAMGFSVVGMPVADVYMSVERGVVDGSTNDFEILVSRRWGDVVKHSAALSMNLVPFYFVMNQDVFDSLPKDVQAVINELGGDWGIELFGDFWEKMQMESWKTWEEKFGGQTHFLTREELEKLDTLTQPVFEKWVKSAEKKGLPAREILATYRELEKQYSIPWSEVQHK